MHHGIPIVPSRLSILIPLQEEQLQCDLAVIQQHQILVIENP